MGGDKEILERIKGCEKFSIVSSPVERVRVLKRQMTNRLCLRKNPFFSLSGL